MTAIRMSASPIRVLTTARASTAKTAMSASASTATLVRPTYAVALWLNIGCANSQLCLKTLVYGLVLIIFQQVWTAKLILTSVHRSLVRMEARVLTSWITTRVSVRISR